MIPTNEFRERRCTPNRLFQQPASDLDDYDTLAKVINALPDLFSEGELEEVRGAYLSFAEQYSADCDSSSPDDLRQEASRIGDIGALLQVDTETAQDTLIEAAREIEREETPDWEDDEYRGGGGRDYEECSDGELDSMFGTLGS